MQLNVIDQKLKVNFRRYLLQVGLATAILAAVMGFEAVVVGDALARAVIVAAVASTAFILFISPHSQAARPRRALGGHLAGLLVPATVAALYLPLASHAVEAPSVVFISHAALAVGGTMFLMAATGTEHPPGAGTALGVVVHGFTWNVALFVGVGVLGMVGMHLLLRERLIDLD